MHVIHWVDVETCGINSKTDALVQVALICTDRAGKLMSERNWLMRPEPGLEIHSRALDLQGKTIEELKAHPYWERDVLQSFGELAHPDPDVTRVLGGFKTAFDRNFLLAGFQRQGLFPPALLRNPKHIDVSKMYFERHGVLVSLLGAAKRYGIVNERPHEGMADLKTTIRVYQELLEESENDAAVRASVMLARPSKLPKKMTMEQWRRYKNAKEE